MKKAIIIDIDNCWMDSRLWLSKAPMESKKDEEWDVFYKRIHLCRANKPFIDDIMEVIRGKDLFPIFVTSRSGTVATQTVLQIQKNSSLRVGDTCALYMRPSRNDFRSSEEVKKDILQEIMKIYEVDSVIDDCMKNLEMFKEHGISKVIHYDIEKHDYAEV